MPYCLNPSCQKPNNSPQNSDCSQAIKFCTNCGRPLQLRGLYESIALIGQGGMGRTFRGRDLGRLGQPCAIKQFLPLQIYNPDQMQKAIALFESEAAQLKKLGSHPQIPELIAYFAEDEYLYLVQELIEGENLSLELQNKGVFTEAQIYELLESLLPVLQFIHDRQVIHRDIKPENIIRRSINFDNQSFVLVDFGAAKIFDGNTGTLIGSAEYIAPEQSRGKALTQSDLYSLGVTCIYLLTGISPFDLYDDASDRWIWQKKAQVTISNHLATILNRLLEKAIAKRYASATQVLADLHSAPNLNIASAQQRTTRNKKIVPTATRTEQSLLLDLQEALNLGQWQEGDLLTNKILLELTQKRKVSELSAAAIKQIPCEICLAIDQAWLKSSNQRFGWSTQKQIWQALGGKLIYTEDDYWQFASTYEKFADRLKWRKSAWLPSGFDLPFFPKVWRKYENLTFAIAAPRGHLPSLLFWEGFNLVDPIFYRLEICE
ncbi:MAG: protein kinase [Pseudanabaena sp.]|nr:MAG: protein kinase [Pseudanabaena sp.]